jgi:hypothetical protein
MTQPNEINVRRAALGSTFLTTAACMKYVINGQPGRLLHEYPKLN